MIIFLSKDENDVMKREGVRLQPGRIATAIVYADDLEKLAQNAMQMDYFFGLKVGKWVDAMPRKT